MSLKQTHLYTVFCLSPTGIVRFFFFFFFPQEKLTFHIKSSDVKIRQTVCEGEWKQFYAKKQRKVSKSMPEFQQFLDSGEDDRSLSQKNKTKTKNQTPQISHSSCPTAANPRTRDRKQRALRQEGTLEIPPNPGHESQHSQFPHPLTPHLMEPRNGSAQGKWSRLPSAV